MAEFDVGIVGNDLQEDFDWQWTDGIDHAEVKEFVANFIESFREHAPDGIMEFVDHLTEFLVPHNPDTSMAPFEFDTAVDEAAGAPGSMPPWAELFHMTGPEIGEQSWISEAFAMTDMPEELPHEADGFWLV